MHNSLGPTPALWRTPVARLTLRVAEGYPPCVCGGGGGGGRPCGPQQPSKQPQDLHSPPPAFHGAPRPCAAFRGRPRSSPPITNPQQPSTFSANPHNPAQRTATMTNPHRQTNNPSYTQRECMEPRAKQEHTMKSRVDVVAAGGILYRVSLAGSHRIEALGSSLILGGHGRSTLAIADSCLRPKQ